MSRKRIDISKLNEGRSNEEEVVFLLLLAALGGLWGCKKAKTFTPELSGRQVRSQEKPGGFFGRRQEGRKVGRREEDWYLTSGGMCQRNSCRDSNRCLWEGLSISW